MHKEIACIAIACSLLVPHMESSRYQLTPCYGILLYLLNYNFILLTLLLIWMKVQSKDRLTFFENISGQILKVIKSRDKERELICIKYHLFYHIGVPLFNMIFPLFTSASKDTGPHLSWSLTVGKFSLPSAVEHLQEFVI